MILGKPWLEEVDAVHHYKTDTITINTGTSQTTINNKEQNTNDPPNLASTSTITSQPTKPYSTPLQSLEASLKAEERRIDNLHHSQNRFAESRWAKYLDIDEMEEEEHNPQKPSTRVEWFTTKVEKRETERARNKEHKADRKQQNKEVVEWLTQEANKNAGETRQEEEYLTKTGLRK